MAYDYSEANDIFDSNVAIEFQGHGNEKFEVNDSQLTPQLKFETNRAAKIRKVKICRDNLQFLDFRSTRMPLHGTESVVLMSNSPRQLDCSTLRFLWFWRILTLMDMYQNYLQF